MKQRSPPAGTAGNLFGLCRTFIFPAFRRVLYSPLMCNRLYNRETTHVSIFSGMQSFFILFRRFVPPHPVKGAEDSGQNRILSQTTKF